MQYKIVGDIEQGIHYTRFIEEMEEDQTQKSEQTEGLEEDERRTGTDS